MNLEANISNWLWMPIPGTTGAWNGIKLSLPVKIDYKFDKFGS